MWNHLLLYYKALVKACLEYYAQFSVQTFEKDLAQLVRLLKTVIVGVENVIYKDRLQKLGWLSEERRISEGNTTVFAQLKGVLPSSSIDRIRDNSL